MKRKVIKQGSNTFTISLPKEWCKANNIEKGTDLEIITQGKEIIISRSDLRSLSAPMFIEFNSRFNNDLIKRFILSIYRAGIDELNIKSFKNPEFVENVLEEETMGFEIIEKNKNFVKIKDIANYNGNTNNFILRIFYLLDECFEVPNSREKMNDKNKILKRFINFSIRSTNKRKDLDKSEYEFHLETLGFLERVRKVLWYLAKETSEKTYVKNEKILNEVKEMFKKTIKTFRSFNEIQIEEIIKTRRKIFNEINEVKDKESVKLLSRIAIVINEIAMYIERIIQKHYYDQYSKTIEKELRNSEKL